jgi:hypothetical protein
MNIYDALLNKKQQDQMYTGCVSSLSPLSVKLYPDDVALICKVITSVIGIKVGSNVIMIKIGNQFIVIGIIDEYIPLIRYVKKASNETVNNSTTLQNDDSLVVSLEASSVFEILAVIHCTGDSGADIKTDWTITGGVTFLNKKATCGASDVGTDALYDIKGTFLSQPYNTVRNYGTSTSESSFIERFLVQTTTIGTLQFRWAQTTAVASDTIVTSDSYIKITKIEI